MTSRITWRQALAWRMERQLVDPPGRLDAAGVVRRLCAVQAQVPSTAELVIRVRSAHADQGVVDAALADGDLVKTWAMRGTLHLLTPEEGGRYLALIAAARPWDKPAWVKWFGMTPEVIADMRAAACEALEGTALTRVELIAAITARPTLRHLDEPLRESWGTALKPLAWQGDLCFGPMRGNQATFTRPDAASPRWAGLPEIEEAAPAAIAAYLRAYGPATAESFHAWAAQWLIGKRMLRSWWAAALEGLAAVEVDGEIAYVVSEDLESLAAARPSSTVRLLPGFDAWVLGPGTADSRVVPPARRSAVSRQSGWISPVVIAGGVVRGTWVLDRDTVRVGWFTEAGPPPDEALGQEVARLAAILGRALAMEVART